MVGDGGTYQHRDLKSATGSREGCDLSSSNLRVSPHQESTPIRDAKFTTGSPRRTNNNPTEAAGKGKSQSSSQGEDHCQHINYVN